MKLNQIILTLFTGMSLLFAQSINTQGVLRDGNGYALDDGSYELTFKIYDAETGGTVKWTGNYPTVTVTNGVFNATLGDESNPVNMLDGSASYWMSIEIGSDGEMSPRLKLNTSAYEMAYLSGSENVFPGAGNVGIGTTSPRTKLDISGDLMLGNDGMLSMYSMESVYGNETIALQTTIDGRAVSDGLGLDYGEYWRYVLALQPEYGLVGIGTTSPKAGLEVFNDKGAIISSDITTGIRTATLRLGSPYTRNHDAYCAKITSTNDPTVNYNSDLRFYTSIGDNASATERMSILSNGNVGIGTPSPSGTLHLSRTSLSAPSLTWGADATAIIRGESMEMAFGSSSVSPWPLYIQGRYNDNTARDIVINPLGGNVGIGTADSDGYNYIRGTTYIDHALHLGSENLFMPGGFTRYIYDNPSDDNDEWQLRHDNSWLLIAKHTNGSNAAAYDGDSNWDFYSDRRLKRDIQNEKNILSRVMQLNVVNYIFKNNTFNKTEIGFIAQDVEPYFPSLVSESFDEKLGYDVKSLGYTTFGVVAIGAIKELKEEKDAEIAELQKTVASLIKRLDALENK